MDTHLTQDPRAYDFQAASWIAQEHATGATLLELHNNHPDTVPSPMTVKRWRREFPAFDLLMVEAEHARADVLIDKTINIADNDDRTAGAARNSIQVRQWIAARLNQSRYGQKSAIDSTHNHSGTVKHESMSVYSDDDLQAIIRAGVKQESQVIEGQFKQIDQGTPGTPPGQDNGGLEAKDGADPPTPKKSKPAPSVSTNVIPIAKPTEPVTEDGHTDEGHTDAEPEF
jgi:hypothetical protein